MVRKSKKSNVFWIAGAAISLIVMIWVAFVTLSPTPIKESRRAAISNKHLVISETSKKSIVDFAQREKIVSGVSIVDVDFNKNARSFLFFYSDVARFQQTWIQFSSKKSNLLFDDEGDRLNERLTNIINGKFDCQPYSSTGAFQIFPEGLEFSPWLCSYAIPPATDKSRDFVGFINIHLMREPTKQEKAKLLTDAKRLSVNIYTRDIMEEKR